MKIDRKNVIVALAVSSIFYVVTYAVNSLSGGYWLKPVSGGVFVYSSGMSASTAILWQPYYGHNSPIRVTPLGWFYYPLIRLDRAFWHPNKDLMRDEQSLFSTNVHLRVHPKFDTKHPDAP